MIEIIKLKDKLTDFSDKNEGLESLCKIEINEINLLIKKKISSNIPLISKITEYIFSSGGKKLRPLLTIGCSKKCGYGFDKNQKRHIGLATAIEFIHTATLMHDDVIDESKMRRGKPSPNDVWGNKTSVLIGDFLFSRAFQLMANDKSSKTLKLLSDTSVIISEGEVLELTNDKNPSISEDIYFEVINKKTASLFSAACQVAGIIANSEINKIEALKTFGTNYGMAFQLIDDALDYSLNANKLGKNIGDDFKEGKITLPVILAYLRSNKDEKNFWERTIKNLDQQKGDLKEGIKLINKYNCIKDTLIRAKHFSNIAIDSLGIFEDNEYKNSLLNMVSESLIRKN